MPFQFTDTSERVFQNLIAKYLVGTHKYVQSSLAEFDKEFCVNENQLMEFIKETQKDLYDFIQQKGERSFLVRLDEKLKADGVIDVLRKGVKHFDKTINLFYRKSSSSYNAKDKANY